MAASAILRLTWQADFEWGGEGNRRVAANAICCRGAKLRGYPAQKRKLRRSRKMLIQFAELRIKKSKSAKIMESSLMQKVPVWWRRRQRERERERCMNAQREGERAHFPQVVSPKAAELPSCLRRFPVDGRAHS